MDIKSVALLIYKAIFTNEDSVEIEFKIYPIEKTRSTKTRYVKLGAYTFIELNPFRITPWGKEKEGHQIMWVMKDKRYVAGVRDGRYQEIQDNSE